MNLVEKTVAKTEYTITISDDELTILLAVLGNMTSFRVGNETSGDLYRELHNLHPNPRAIGDVWDRFPFRKDA